MGNNSEKSFFRLLTFTTMAEFESSKLALSGLAGEIRSSTVSEQFDLSGYTELRIYDLISAAFSTPLTEPPKMVKFTFVVGGGKLVRAKYNDDMSKWMITKLREVGYKEDRSAAETFDSQGTFKQQHDTGQNLKYLIVFPFVTCANKKESSSTDSDNVVLDTSSPQYIVCACEVSTFKEIVLSKVTSYKQKKKLIQVIHDNAEEFKRIEEKLVSCVPLSSLEQAKYDANSGQDSEKLLWLQGEIKQMIDNGQLNAAEKADLLQQIDNNVKSLNNEINEATTEGKPKKVEKLKSKLEPILIRKAVVEKIVPIKEQLSQGDKIEKLYFKLFPLLALEDKGRSMSLTLADLKTLEDKGSIEDSIRALEAASRGWFVEDADFEELCKKQEKTARTKFSNMKPVASSSSKKVVSSSSQSSSSWATASSSKKGGSSGTSKQSVGVNKKSTGFAAAFGGSDSD